MTAERSNKTGAGAKSPPKRRQDDQPGSSPMVADALRTAYEEAVKEDVPAEFLDLLNKLS